MALYILTTKNRNTKLHSRWSVCSASPEDARRQLRQTAQAEQVVQVRLLNADHVDSLGPILIADLPDDQPRLTF